MQKIITCILVICLCSYCSSSKIMDSGGEIDLEIQNEPKYVMGSRQEPGVVSFKIAGRGQDKIAASNAAKQHAVKAVLFKGIPGSNCEQPLIRDLDTRQKNRHFFKNFFKDGGDYTEYIVSSNVDPGDIVRIKRNYYQVNLEVKVNYLRLLKKMKNEISLNTGL